MPASVTTPGPRAPSVSFIHPTLAVLDMQEAVRSGYDAHQPHPAAFFLPRPYQSSAADVTDNATSTASPPSSDAEERGDVAAGKQQEPSRQRKRARRSKYQPNERQRDADARHAQVEPLLSAAVTSLHSWIQARGAKTLRKALGGTVAAAAEAGAELPAGAAEGREAAPLPNYLVMASMQHVVQPTFQWHMGVDSSDAPPEGQRQWPHSGEECPLFGQLICNDSARERCADAFGHTVLIPAQSSFIMTDIKELRLLTTAAPHAFSCILIDPPWENKSVKRGAASLYPSLPAFNLLNLPVRQLASSSGCLVALWVTNREKLRRFVEEQLLQAWGLRRCGTWHWLKVADGGEPVSPLHVAHRRPYESLLLCYMADAPPPWELCEAACEVPPDVLVIVATPAQHSRKPPLEALLQRHLPKNARCLEMFARCVTKGWTSWGNEALKFQGKEHFVRGL